MGTTLTGLTPATTYDALIKVTDNGPLGGSLKTLTDGLGNDSALALSTGAASVTGTLSVSSNLTVDTNTLFVDATNNRVGVGTASPDSNLVVDGSGSVRVNLKASNTRYGTIYADSGILALASITAIPLVLATDDTERLRITSTGNVGIGTSSPSYKLEVNGNAYCTDLSLPASGGIYFDSGAGSKYLDDYEFGTWTMGLTFGGASTGITYTTNTGTYTKIGRQVTVNGLIQLSNKGSSTGGVRITGLPFNVANTNGNYSQSSLRVKNISFLNAYQGYAEINTTTIVLEQVTNLGVVTAITDTNFANNSEIIISLTYFV